MSAAESFIEIEYVDMPGTGPAVLVPEPRIRVVIERNKAKLKDLKKSVAALEAEAATATGDALALCQGTLAEKQAQVAALEAQNRFAEENSKTLRERFKGKIKTRVFNFTPYTWGGKNLAVSKATSYDSGDPKLDNFRLRVLLIAESTRLTESEIEELSPAIGEALANEVMERSEPDPYRLDFLSL